MTVWHAMRVGYRRWDPDLLLSKWKVLLLKQGGWPGGAGGGGSPPAVTPSHVPCFSVGSFASEVDGIWGDCSQ